MGAQRTRYRLPWNARVGASQVHRLEQRNDREGNRIHGPRQIYVGERIRPFEDRGTQQL